MNPLTAAAQRGEAITAFPVIDAHAHIGSYQLTPQARFFTAMARCGVRRMMISSSLAIAGEIVLGNDETLAAVRQWPEHFGGYVVVNPHFPHLLESELERCLDLPGIHGIKVYQLGIAYDDPRFTPVWRVAEQRRLPILAHTWAGNLTGFDRAAERHPDAWFIAAHAGSGMVYQPYIAAARRHPNLVIDLAYSRDHPGLVERLVGELGNGRILWGSDFPVFSLGHQLAKVLYARLSEADMRALLSDNARRLFPRLLP